MNTFYNKYLRTISYFSKFFNLENLYLLCLALISVLLLLAFNINISYNTDNYYENDIDSSFFQEDCDLNYICTKPKDLNSILCKKDTIWEKLFGKGKAQIHSYKSHLYLIRDDLKSNNIILSEENKNTFKSAFNEQKLKSYFEFKDLEIGYLEAKDQINVIIKSISEYTKEVENVESISDLKEEDYNEWDKMWNQYSSISNNIDFHTSSDECVSVFSDSSSDSDKTITPHSSKVTSITPNITLTDTDNSTVCLDTNHIKTKNNFICSKDKIDKSFLYKDKISDNNWLNFNVEHYINNKNATVIEKDNLYSSSDKGWDSYFDYEDETGYYDSGYKKLYSEIELSGVLDKHLNVLSSVEQEVFKPLVLEELYRMSLSDNFDLNDSNVVTNIICFCVYRDPDLLDNPYAYLEYLENKE